MGKVLKDTRYCTLVQCKTFFTKVLIHLFDNFWHSFGSWTPPCWFIKPALPCTQFTAVILSLVIWIKKNFLRNLVSYTIIVSSDYQNLVLIFFIMPSQKEASIWGLARKTLFIPSLVVSLSVVCHGQSLRSGISADPALL